ncbi:unnamed protein product [Victoria cruziana]
MASSFTCSLCFLFIIGLSLLGGCIGRPLYPLPSKRVEENQKPLQTLRPYNVAHRGSNGEFPEETSAAYVRAIEEGADFIETDILATKDGALVCFHDVTLDDITDIAMHKEFADRKRTYEVQGYNLTGFFTVDFTLEEIQTLRVKQRFSFRDPSYNERSVTFPLHLMYLFSWFMLFSFQVKWTDGKRFEDKVIETLLKYGYKGAYMSKHWLQQPIFIQSFAPSSLVYISNLTDSPKIFLIDDVSMPTQDTNQSYWEITSDGYFDFIKDFVVGIGPWKDTVVPPMDNHLATATDLVAKAHAHNLQVHPYTYRNEHEYLHFDFHQDPYAEYDYWINKIGIDGLFTDFPGSLHKFQEWTSPSRKS